MNFQNNFCLEVFERDIGFEPISQPWKGHMLAVKHQSRILHFLLRVVRTVAVGRDGFEPPTSRHYSHSVEALLELCAR